MILVTANLARWRRKGRRLPTLAGFAFIEPEAIAAATLKEVDLVLSALMDDGFDALDVARRLAKAGFRGRYRAVTVPLPDPGAVLAEVRAEAPGLDFDLFILIPQARP